LFLATPANVYICENPLDALQGKPVSFDPVDMEFNTIHSILFSNDTLYIASDDGLTLIPWASIGDIQAILPIPYMKSIVVNDKEHSVAEKLIQVRGKNRVQFAFGSISYSGSPMVFSYMLEGLDNEWKTGSQSNVVYQNLARGNYQLKLRVRKPTTTWSEAIHYDVVVQATLLQQPWFYVMSFIFLAGLAIIMALWQKNKRLKRRETEHQLVMLEQKSLQSMMNPHFIFNTLGSIQKYLLQNKADAAGLFLSQFARLIRQNISAIKSGMTGLDEEIDRLKNYLELEQLRMQNKFDYRVTVDSDVNEDEIMIPSMILQPIVENAIWHGVSAIEGQGLISISFHLHSHNALKVIVSDNGPGLTKAHKIETSDDKHLHLGMELTRKRLAILGKRQHVKTTVEITEINPGSTHPGARVVLIIPFNYGDIE
jgi:two-component sensor histidine kinase